MALFETQRLGGTELLAKSCSWIEKTRVRIAMDMNPRCFLSVQVSLLAVGENGLQVFDAALCDLELLDEDRCATRALTSVKAYGVGDLLTVLEHIIYA